MYRDCQGWKDCGMPMTTTSNEACKLFDATLQMMVTREVSPYGDLMKVMPELSAADPECVLVQAMIFNLTLAEGTTNRFTDDVQLKAQQLQALVEKQADKITDRERRHAMSALYMSKNQWAKSREELMKILIDHPRDMLALKLYYLYCIYTGYFEEMRDVMAHVIAAYQPSDVEYGYVLGMYAFALQETHFYEKGRVKGLQALEINRKDTWSTHTMAHVYLMTGENDTGIDFMNNTLADWEGDGGLACHNHWHTSLFHVEKGDFKSALDIYDQQVSKRALSDRTMFQMTDGVSLLYRLKLEGVDPGRERWADMLGLCEPHLGVHTTCFNDCHIMMAACSNDRDDLGNKMLESMKAMIKGEKSYVQQTTEECTLAVCEAVAAYERKDYDVTVELLRPIKYKTDPIGGSAAQRDVIQQLLLHSAIKSNNPHDNHYATQLLLERKAFMGNSPQADRLLARAMANHNH